MRWVVRIFAVMVLALTAADAQAPRRVALVIGNANYAAAAALANPPNDARLVADALRRAGFQTVDVKANLPAAPFRAALRAFRQQAAGAQVALVYYAGHGIEAKGKNWLIPVDAALNSDLDLVDEAIDLDRVIEDVSGADLRVVIVDACRNNPFGRTWRSGTRAVQRGLGPIDADDVLVIFAAAPGQTASDGEGASNSPFAQALARRLPQADLPVQVLGNVVRDDVLRATGNTQRPFVSASMTGELFYLVPRTAMAPDPEVERLRRENEALRKLSDDLDLAPMSSKETSVLRQTPSGGATSEMPRDVRPVRTFIGHVDTIYSVRVSPDGRSLATASRDATVRLWDIASGAEARIITGHLSNVYTAEFSPDGKRLASGDSGGLVQVNVVERRSVETSLQLSGPLRLVQKLSFFSDGQRLAIQSLNKNLYIWRIGSPEPEKILDLGTGEGISGFALASNDQKVLAVSDYGQLASWSSVDWVRAYSGSRLTELGGRAFALSPDGSVYVFGATNSKISFVAASTGSVIREIDARAGSVYDLRFSRDGRRIAAALEYSTALVIDAGTGAVIRRYSPIGGTVFSVDFSADGRQLMTGGGSNKAHLWPID
ncbi:MAG: caspase family protein [Phycisphaerae bacterium]|nr:caspase family protein [Phycisphaerae bacterium]